MSGRGSDDLLKGVGQFGNFQKRTVMVISLAALFSASTAVLCNVFVVYTPPHRCFIPEIDDDKEFKYLQDDLPDINSSHLNDSNQTRRNQLSRYIPLETTFEGNRKWSQCYRYKETIPSENNSSVNVTIVPCDAGWRYFVEDGYVSASMEFDLVCGKAWMAPFSSTCHLFGFLVGTISGGFLSDRFGRRKVFLLSWILLSICTIGIAVFPLWELSYLLWFVMGCCVLIRSITGVVIINEQTPAKYRYSSCTCYALSCAGCAMLVALFNYLIPNWRHFMTIFGVIQFAISALIYCFVHESLSWLLQKSNKDEALRLLKRIARANKKKSTDEDSSVISEKNDILLEDDSEEKKQKEDRMSYIDLFKIAFLRKRVFILSIAWSAAVLNFHCLSLGTNLLGGNRFANAFLSALLEIPGQVLCYLGLKRIGGRISFVVLVGFSGICVLTSLPLWKVSEAAETACNLSGKMFAAGALSTLYVIGGDFYPTLLRSQSYGASSVLSRILSMLAPFLLFLGEKFSKAIPFAVMGLVSLIAANGMLFLPETRNVALPETLEEAKRQDKLPKGCFCCRSSNKKFSTKNGSEATQIASQENLQKSSSV